LAVVYERDLYSFPRAARALRDLAEGAPQDAARPGIRNQETTTQDSLRIFSFGLN